MRRCVWGSPQQSIQMIQEWLLQQSAVQDSQAPSKLKLKKGREEGEKDCEREGGSEHKFMCMRKTASIECWWWKERPMKNNSSSPDIHTFFMQWTVYILSTCTYTWICPQLIEPCIFGDSPMMCFAKQFLSLPLVVLYQHNYSFM